MQTSSSGSTQIPMRTPPPPPCPRPTSRLWAYSITPRTALPPRTAASASDALPPRTTAAPDADAAGGGPVVLADVVGDADAINSVETGWGCGRARGRRGPLCGLGGSRGSCGCGECRRSPCSAAVLDPRALPLSLAPPSSSMYPMPRPGTYPPRAHPSMIPRLWPVSRCPAAPVAVPALVHGARGPAHALAHGAAATATLPMRR